MGRQSVPVVVFSRGEEGRSVAKRVVERLLAGIPAEYTLGLDQVVLREARNLTGRDKRRKTSAGGRKGRLRDVLGLYHRASRTRRAWIELFVDNIVSQYPRFFLRIPILADYMFAHTLFHELGHHVHSTAHPEHRSREVVAEDWVKVLGRAYFRNRYWYLVPFRPALRVLVRLLRLRSASAVRG